MKILNGKELAEFIKVRQERQVRSFQNAKIVPKLAIIRTNDDPVIDIFIKLKQRYAQDIGAEVQLIDVPINEAETVITQANQDGSVHGIIVQMPLGDDRDPQPLLDQIVPEKDVDGLATKSNFDPATPTAIIWLLSGYNVELAGKKIVVVGNGRLVGKPLSAILKDSGYDVTTLDIDDDAKAGLADAEVIITATGSAGLITSDMIMQDAIVVDAGVAVDKGVTKGDLAADVYERDDLTITPTKGGVGPLTVCALFENVIIAARSSIN